MNKIQVVISKEMEEVLNKAQIEFGITKEQAFEKAFALLKIYTEEKSKNNNFAVCDNEGKVIKTIK